MVVLVMVVVVVTVMVTAMVIVMIIVMMVALHVFGAETVVKILSTKMRITVRVPLRGIPALLLRGGDVEVEEFAIEELGAIGEATVATGAYCIGILSLELIWELVRLLLI